MTRFFAMSVCCAVLMSACGRMHVIPPTDVSDPALVHIVDYGDTSRLVLLRDENRAVEYGFGDWSWYARGNKNFGGGAMALLMPTHAALARREHALTDAPIPFEVPEQIEEIFAIEVEAADTQALIARLDAVFEATQQTATNEARGIEYAQAPGSYWIFRQSSTEICEWLEDLGCAVDGWTLIAAFAVQEH